MALLIATHQPTHFAELSNHVYELSGGKIHKTVVATR